MHFFTLAALMAAGTIAQSTSSASDNAGSSTSSPPPRITAPATGTATTAAGTRSMIVTSLYGLDYSQSNYRGIVLAADQTSTTIIVRCNPTLNITSVEEHLCAFEGITITYGSTDWLHYTSIAASGRTYVVSDQCTLTGTTEVACTTSFSRNFVLDTAHPEDDITSSLYSSTFTSPDLPVNLVTLNAGLEMLSANATSTGSSAATSASAGSTAPAAPTSSASSTNATSQSAAQRATVIGSSIEKGAIAAFVSVMAASALFAVLL